MPGPPEFRPPAWLRGGMAQTIWSNYAPRSGPGRAFRDAAVTRVLATDDDDRSKGNGPSFTFRMDPNADDIIRASFKVHSSLEPD